MPPQWRMLSSTAFATPRRGGLYLSDDEAVEGLMAYRANHQADAQEDLKAPALRHQ